MLLEMFSLLLLHALDVKISIQLSVVLSGEHSLLVRDSQEKMVKNMYDSMAFKYSNCLKNIWGPSETLVKMVLKIDMGMC